MFDIFGPGNPGWATHGDESDVENWIFFVKINVNSLEHTSETVEQCDMRCHLCVCVCVFDFNSDDQPFWHQSVWKSLPSNFFLLQNGQQQHQQQQQLHQQKCSTHVCIFVSPNKMWFLSLSRVQSQLSKFDSFIETIL